MKEELQAKQPKPRIKRRPILILASIGILGLAHTPIPKQKPDKEFVKRVYVRKTGEQRWYASEKRKKEIIAEIRKIRQRIRQQAEEYNKKDPRKNVIYLSIKL